MPFEAHGALRTSFLDGLVTVDAADINKPIYLLAGHTLANKKLGYDIAITMNTAGSGAATISWKAELTGITGDADRLKSVSVVPT